MISNLSHLACSWLNWSTPPPATVRRSLFLLSDFSKSGLICWRNAKKTLLLISKRSWLTLVQSYKARKNSILKTVPTGLVIYLFYKKSPNITRLDGHIKARATLNSVHYAMKTAIGSKRCDHAQYNGSKQFNSFQFNQHLYPYWSKRNIINKLSTISLYQRQSITDEENN